jgi:hypothetical protein
MAGKYKILMDENVCEILVALELCDQNFNHTELNDVL